MAPSNYDSFSTILITGGGGGLGLALAKNFISHGKKVIIAGRTASKLASAAQELGPSCIDTITIDVARLDSLASFAKQLVEKHPQLDGVLLNAGVQYRLDFASASASGGAVDAGEWKDEIDININSVVALVSELLPHLQSKPSACLMTVSSGLSLVPLVSVPVYCGTKFFVKAFTLSLRRQLQHAGSKVRVVEIVPPLVESDLHRAVPAEERAKTDKGAITQQQFVDEVQEAMLAGKDECSAGFAKGAGEKWHETFGKQFAGMNPAPQQ